MAEELGKFIPLVGGPSHGHVLLMPLEALSMVEETVVRDKAVESINIIAAELPEASIAEHLIPLVQVSVVCSGTAVLILHPSIFGVILTFLTSARSAAGDGRVVYVASVVMRRFHQRIPAGAREPARRPADIVCAPLPR